MLIAAYLIAHDTMVWRMCRLFSLRFRVIAPDAIRSSLMRLFMVEDWTGELDSMRNHSADPSI